MMALEGPYIAAIVARMPEAARGLAAFGVAVSLAWLIESPIMMLLSASAALVRDRLAVPPLYNSPPHRLNLHPHNITPLTHNHTTERILYHDATGYEPT